MSKTKSNSSSNILMDADHDRGVLLFKTLLFWLNDHCGPASKHGEANLKSETV